MDSEHRRIIKDQYEFLEQYIDVEKLKPSLLKYKVFTLAMLRDITSCFELFRELPTRGPHAFESFIKVLKTEGYIFQANFLEGCALSHLEIGPSATCDTYTMSSKPLGYCLIINIVNFPKHPEKDRLGSDKDAAALLQFFTEIGYDVQPERNLTVDSIKSTLKNFSEKDFSNVDSCIVIILTHGSNKENVDVLCGSDEEYISKTEIVNYFSNGNCQTLLHKPKMFFFEACRGKLKNVVVETNNSLAVEFTDAAPNTLSAKCSDTFIVHSSLPYHESYRVNEGAWFCQILVEVLKNNFRTHDLESMIKIANKKIMEKVTLKWNSKQALHWEAKKMSKSIVFFTNTASKAFSP